MRETLMRTSLGRDGEASPWEAMASGPSRNVLAIRLVLRGARRGPVGAGFVARGGIIPRE